jgi:hypothetical protein
MKKSLSKTIFALAAAALVLLAAACQNPETPAPAGAAEQAIIDGIKFDDATTVDPWICEAGWNGSTVGNAPASALDTVNQDPSNGGAGCMRVEYASAVSGGVTALFTIFSGPIDLSACTGFQFDVRASQVDGFELLFRNAHLGPTINWAWINDFDEGQSFHGAYTPDTWVTVQIPFSSFYAPGYGETENGASLTADLAGKKITTLEMGVKVWNHAFDVNYTLYLDNITVY